jgi:acyl-CoA hydrolase
VEPRPPSASSSILSRWMGVADANNAGNVHGGLIMHLCDEVAGIAAVRHSGARVVTAAMDRMNFRHPVYVGQLVTVKATVNAAWRTSMEVGVRVESENVRTGELLHTSTAYLTMVALDDEGNPTEVPLVAPETPDETRRAREAQLRRDTRLAERQRIEEERTAQSER